MGTMISIGDALLVLLAILGAILLINLIIVVKNLIPTVKSLARTMEDVERITAACANSTEKADEVVTEVTGLFTTLILSIRNQTSFVSIISAIQRFFYKATEAAETMKEDMEEKEEEIKDEMSN